MDGPGEGPKVPIRSWAQDEKPREKMLQKGAQSLSNAELIAILIRIGTRDESAVQLAQRLLRSSDERLGPLGKYSVKELMQFKGMGMAKAVSVAAALELGRRRREEESVERGRVDSSKDAFELMHGKLADLPHEEFWVILLNRANSLISSVLIGRGGISGTVADTRLIFRSALQELACSIIICHNHPSGNLEPSKADISLTRKLREAGELMDIPVLDHLIVGDRDYYSFADQGML